MAHHQASIDDAIMDGKTNHLTQVMSSGAVSMSPELFEKLYLTPKTPSHGDVRRFANPTPLGFVGFVISTMSFSMILMGWGGASGVYPVIGIFFFVGPLLLVLSTIFEWILGNFFSMMVQGLFSVFWLSFGMLNLPTLGLAAQYKGGAADPEYNAGIALYLIVWGFALFTFFLFTLKTNVVFALIFGLVTVASWVLSGAYWHVASGNYVVAGHLQTAGGALLFVVGLLGWYMTIVMMCAEMRVTVNLPVGDLSHFWPRTDIEIGAAEKQA